MYDYPIMRNIFKNIGLTGIIVCSDNVLNIIVGVVC